MLSKNISFFLQHILKKGLYFEEENAIKDIRNLFRQGKENKAIKDRILRNTKSFFEHYYKPVRISNLWSKNYIEYKSNGDRNKTLSVDEYPNKVRPHLKDIINNLKKSDILKI